MVPARMPSCRPPSRLQAGFHFVVDGRESWDFQSGERKIHQLSADDDVDASDRDE